MVSVSAALRFILELVAIVALAIWGNQRGSGDLRWLLTILAPGLLILFWAVVVAPRAKDRLSQPARLVIGSGALLISAALLATVGQPLVGLVVAAAIVVNTVLLLRAGH